MQQDLFTFQHPRGWGRGAAQGCLSHPGPIAVEMLLKVGRYDRRRKLRQNRLATKCLSLVRKRRQMLGIPKSLAASWK